MYSVVNLNKWRSEGGAGVRTALGGNLLEAENGQ